MNKFLIIVFFSFLSHNIICQNQILIDSLNIVIRTSNQPVEKLKAYDTLFDEYMFTDYAKALEIGKLGYQLAIQEDNIERQAKYLHKIGNVYLYMGNYQRSLESYFSASKLLDGNSNYYLEFALYNNIGGVYDRIQQYDLALEYLFKALETFNSHHHTFHKGVNKSTLHAQVFNNIGNNYEVKNLNKKALQYYKQALEVTQEGKIKPQSLAEIHNNLGKLYRKLKDYPSSKIHLEKGLELRIANDDYTGIFKSYNNLSNYYLDNGKPDSALVLMDNAYDLVMQSNSLELRTMYYYTISIIFAAKGKFEKAYKVNIRYQECKDSLVNKQNLMQISNLETQQKIDNLEKEFELKQQKVKFRNTLLIIGLLSIAIVAIFLIALITLQKKRIKTEKNALEADLDFRNKEMATNVMYLVRKNELINNVAKRLLRLKEKLKEENKTPINSIIYELQTEIDKEVWGEFEMRFQQVHKDFYDNLRSSHPDLTPAEERLCAFLRLNMSSKEIAAINHQNAKSIEVARARLRKKLNLTGTDTNLISYLSEF